MLSMKGECTFRLLDFLIIGLCNSLANYLLEIFSFLIPLPQVFLSSFCVEYISIPFFSDHDFIDPL